ncbi:PTS glucose transporter subunit IIA [Clostridiaceae bacterium M8S5]|nr:PTS glucose transporter subunit IIA [Clostridiaceae bacterium M8S5]
MLGIFKKNIKVQLLSPIEGNVIDIENVEDEVFSQKMLGDGVAIDPLDNKVVSPCDGEILQVFPTKHAVGIKSNDGLEILIHIGIDTVNLKGQGFESFVKQGDVVKAGDILMQLDVEYLRKNAKSLVSPVIITNGEIVKDIEKFTNKVVKNTDIIMNIDIKK